MEREFILGIFFGIFLGLFLAGVLFVVLVSHTVKKMEETKERDPADWWKEAKKEDEEP